MPAPLEVSTLLAESSKKRVRSNSDEEAFFLLEEKDALGIHAAIEATITPDVKRRARDSLQETLADIRDEYPEAQDIVEARGRAAADLSELAERLSTPGSVKPMCSPAMSAGVPPLQLPPMQEELLFGDASSFVEHDGLLDHEQIMQAIYLSQGLDLSAMQSKAHTFLSDLGLRPHDLGVKNTDESGKVLMNQCFYLSIAHAYLGNLVEAEDVSSLALSLKRAIETAVLAARPGSAASDKTLGEEAMAFADFLPIAMHAGSSGDSTDNAGEPNLTSQLAICVLDSVQGHVEVFLGPKYQSLDQDAQSRNLILLWYTPGHYQSVVCDDTDGSKVFMPYDEFKALLSKSGVLFIETTE